jgi:hypothetical protein
MEYSIIVLVLKSFIIRINIQYLYSNDENFKELIYGWFFVIFHRLLIDFA